MKLIALEYPDTTQIYDATHATADEIEALRASEEAALGEGMVNVRTLANVHRVPFSDGDSLWVCSDCGDTLRWSWDNVAVSGKPVCPKCDGDDMELP